MSRARWYVVDPIRRNGAAVASCRWEWLARLVSWWNGFDYGKPGTFHKRGAR